MSSPIQHVQPGELIRHIDFNHMADHINDLLQRVADLEQLVQPGSTVTLKPLLGSVRIGDAITVEGTNFAVPVLLNTVRLDNVTLTQFNPGTDDSHLIFNVPTISGVPRDVTFSVTNANGSASMPITVLPAGAQVPVGEMRIVAQSVNTGVIAVGQTYTFPFVLDSQTNVTEEYLLVVQYANAQGAPVGSWGANTTLRNLTNQPIDRVTVTPGSPVSVNVTVTIPTGATRADLLLRAISVNSPQDPLLNVTSSPLPIVIGQAPVVSDPRTTFGSLIVSPASRLVNDQVLGPVIVTAAGQQTLVRVTAEFTVAGTYSYSGIIVPAADTLWTAAVSSPPLGNSTETEGSSQDVVVQLNALATDAQAPRTLEIHAARTGPSGETFDSWFRIPIRNA